ncbi:MAG: DNA polymerase III subunit delta [Brockia lithotrophica]|nr:DNA polymerase III subunit delta [Brockia lithotrophica]
MTASSSDKPRGRGSPARASEPKGKLPLAVLVGEDASLLEAVARSLVASLREKDGEEGNSCPGGELGTRFCAAVSALFPGLSRRLDLAAFAAAKAEADAPSPAAGGDWAAEGFETIVLDVEADGWEAVVREWASGSFFSRGKLLWAKGATFLGTAEGGKPLREFEVWAEEAERNWPQETALLIFVPQARLDRRKRAVAWVERHAAGVLSLGLPAARGRIAFVQEVARASGIRFTEEALAYLEYALPAEYSALRLAVDKLALYAQTRKGEVLGGEEVRLLIPPPEEGDAFPLLSAVWRGDVREMEMHWSALPGGPNEAIRLLALVAQRIERFLVLRHLKGQGHRTEEDLARASGMHPYAVRMALRESARYSEEELVRYYLEAAELDGRFKSVYREEERREALWLFLLRIATKVAHTSAD